MKKEVKDQEKPKMLYLPYIEAVSERIERLSSTCKNSIQLRKNTETDTHTCKEHHPEEKKQGVVYEVPCKDCEAVYIGSWKKSSGES